MTWNQPECDCGVRPSQRHLAGCNALLPPDEQDPAVRRESEERRPVRGEN